MAGLLVVVGPPAVGKSTACRGLCASFDRSLHVPVDDLRLMVHGGLAMPSEDWTPEIAEQLRLARLTALDMAGRYRAAGFTVVLDDFVDPGGLTEYADLTPDPLVRRVLLWPDRQEAHRRNRVREPDGPGADYIDRGIRHVYGVLDGLGDQLVTDGWTRVDSTRLSVEETVATILGR